jgi:hypothetical protein
MTVVDNVNQHKDLKLPFYDPADLHVNEITGKAAHLVFHADCIQKINVSNQRIFIHAYSGYLGIKICVQEISKAALNGNLRFEINKLGKYMS